MKAKRREEPGLTLIELLMVLVVIGVMVAIAIPQFAENTKKAADKRAQTDAKSRLTLAQAAAQER